MTVIENKDKHGPKKRHNGRLPNKNEERKEDDDNDDNDDIVI